MRQNLIVLAMVSFMPIILTAYFIYDHYYPQPPASTYNAEYDPSACTKDKFELNRCETVIEHNAIEAYNKGLDREPLW